MKQKTSWNHLFDFMHIQRVSFMSVLKKDSLLMINPGKTWILTGGRRISPNIGGNDPLLSDDEQIWRPRYEHLTNPRQNADMVSPTWCSSNVPHIPWILEWWLNDVSPSGEVRACSSNWKRLKQRDEFQWKKIWVKDNMVFLSAVLLSSNLRVFNIWSLRSSPQIFSWKLMFFNWVLEKKSKGAASKISLISSNDSAGGRLRCWSISSW